MSIWGQELGVILLVLISMVVCIRAILNIPVRYKPKENLDIERHKYDPHAHRTGKMLF